jgi:NAD(P)-dependent dehydrogenase (short-subunit alcohol dehydrogenase family)
MARLKGKRIFLTGAAQGIGYAIAEACLREKAELFLVDRDADLLAESAARLGGVAHAAADIADAKAIDAAMQAAAKAIGPINTVINNAGMNVFSTPLEASEDDWTRNLDVNVKGAWHCAKAALPGMIGQGGGVILNIASTHAFTIIPHTFPYPVAKHALLGLTRSLAIE